MIDRNSRNDFTLDRTARETFFRWIDQEKRQLLTVGNMIFKKGGMLKEKESQTSNSLRKRQSSLSLSIRFASDIVANTCFSKTKINKRMRPVMKRNFLVPVKLVVEP